MAEKQTPLYVFITSVMAIVGGVFTTLGLLEGMVFNTVKILSKKVD